MKQRATLPYLMELRAKIARSEKKAAKSKKEKEQWIKDTKAAQAWKGASEVDAKTANENVQRITAHIMILTLEVDRLKKEEARLTNWMVDWSGEKAREIEAAKKQGYDEAVRSWEPKRISQEKTIEDLKGKVELARREGNKEGLMTGDLERARLLKENEQLLRESARAVDLQKELLEQSKLNDALKQKVNIQSNEIKKASKENIQLNLQIDENNSELVTRDETIKKLQEARREEIESEAQTLFHVRMEKWGREEKPKELFDESSRILIQVIGARNQDSLPEELQPMTKMVEKIIRSRVDKEINKEFWSRVKVEAEKLAKTWFRQKWPEWSKANVEPKVKELEEMIDTNGITSLSSLEWTVACKQCGTKQHLELTNERISVLMSRGVVQVQCINQNCHPLWDLLNLYRYSFGVSLHELISAYLIKDSGRK